MKQSSLIGSVLADAYRVEEQRTENTYRALRFQDRRAATVTLLALSEDLAAELSAEIKAPNSPRVRPIWAAGLVNTEQGFLIEPELGTRTLDDLLDKGAFAPVRAVGVLTQLLEGLDAVHACGHSLGDLRSADVHVQEKWGVEAITIPSTSWTLGSAAGRVPGGYCSPEFFHAGATVQGDIYSVGVIAFELFTGTTPHDPSAPPGDRTLVEDLSDMKIPPELLPWLSRMLKVSPALRFQCVAEALRELASATSLLEKTSMGSFTPMITDRAVGPTSSSIKALVELGEEEGSQTVADPIFRTFLLLVVVIFMAMGLSWLLLQGV